MIRGRLHLLPLLIIALFQLTNNCWGATIYGKVTGRPDNLPLPGAHIMVVNQSSGAFSEKDGTYQLNGLPAGKVTIRVSFLGYKTHEKSLSLKEGERLKVDFILDPEAINAAEIEILDTKAVRGPQDEPVRLEIIPARTIANNPGQSLVSVFDYVSGINLSSTMGIFANNTTVTLRGLSGNDQSRTLVLFDDIPMNKADEGSVNWNLINRENVDQIEVQKGPGSAKYGAGAMGGVINIRSKRPTRLIAGVASVDYGTFNTAGLKYQLGGKLKPGNYDKGFFYGLNGFYRRSDGYNPEIPQYLEKTDTFYVNNYLREASVGIKAGYQFNALNTIEAGATFFNDKRGRGTEVYEVDGAFERHGTWQANVRYRGGTGKVKWNLLAYNQDEHFERLNEYMREGEYNLYLVQSHRIDRGAGVNTEIPAGSHQVLTAGIDYQYGSVYGQDIYYTSTDLITNAGRMDTRALYIQDEISLAGKKLQINLGLRMNSATFHDGSFKIDDPSYSIQYLVDYQDSLFPRTSWFRADPKFSIQYRFTPVSRLYFSAAQGFRAPNLDDLCRTGKIRNGFKVANPALKPEVLTNFEVGTDLLLGRKLHTAASFYYSIGSDFMYYVSTGDSVNMGYKLTPVFMKQNISKVEIAGIEVDIDIEPFPWLSLFANYTFNHSIIRSFTPRDSAVDKDLNGKYLTDVPMHKGSAGITFKNKYVNANLLWKYTGKRYINDVNETDTYLLTSTYPAYQTVGLRVWHTFFRHITTALNIDNMFDAIFIDDRLQQSPGRMITAEISVSF